MCVCGQYIYLSIYTLTIKCIHFAQGKSAQGVVKDYKI